MADEIAKSETEIRPAEASTPERTETALVLSGGGARGMFQAGALEVLLGTERVGEPRILSGTSAGAINAALLASTGKVEDLLAFWTDAGSDQPVRATAGLYTELYGRLEELVREEGPTIVSQRGYWSTLTGFITSRRETAGDLLARAAVWLLKERYPRLIDAVKQVPQSSFFDNDLLRKLLVRKLGTVVKPRDGVALVVSVVDALRGTVLRFTTRDLWPGKKKGEEYAQEREIPVDVILASASIPMLLPAVPAFATTLDSHGNPVPATRLCWDGGLLVNTPLAPAVDLGAASVVTILCTVGETVSEPTFDNLNHALERLADTFFENTYNVDRKLLLTRNRLAGSDKNPPGNYLVKLYKPVRPKPGDVNSYVEFTDAAMTHMKTRGNAAARAWLDLAEPTDTDIEVSPPSGDGFVPL